MASLWDYLNKTNLPTEKEVGYQIKKSNSPFANDSGMDYDLRGFYNKYGTLQPTATNGHLTDEFKTQIHPTFSIESKYYTGEPYAVDWESEQQPYKRLSELGIM
jgi:hypothetical protein